jgi:hypothetical protein
MVSSGHGVTTQKTPFFIFPKLYKSLGIGWNLWIIDLSDGMWK